MDADLNRRRFIECFSAFGAGAALLPGALAAIAQDAATITPDMLRDAMRIAGVSFTPDEQRRLLEKLNGARGYQAGYARLRDANRGTTQPAIVFNPVLPGKTLPAERRPLRRQPIDVPAPRSDEEVAFLPLTHLSKLVEARKIAPTDLTKLYLSRLKNTTRCTASSRSPRSSRCGRRARRIARSPPAAIAALSTASRTD